MVIFGYHASLYINSDVMIINLKKWREASHKGYFNDFVDNNRNRMKLNDQDVINSVSQNQIAGLHLRYNVTNFCYGIHKKLTLTHQKQLKEALKHPVIVHFTNWNKPWIAENFHYFKSAYLTTMSHTPYQYLIPNLLRIKDRRLWLINGIKYWCAYILDVVKYKSKEPIYRWGKIKY